MQCCIGSEWVSCGLGLSFRWELLELILSRLCLEDIVRLSCVCKKWRHVDRSLHVMKWVKLESLNGATVFVSTYSSLSATDVPGISRNSIYFSKFHCYGKFSYIYSLDDCRFNVFFKIELQDPFENFKVDYFQALGKYHVLPPYLAGLLSMRLGQDSDSVLENPKGVLNNCSRGIERAILRFFSHSIRFSSWYMMGRKRTRKTEKQVRVGELRPWSELQRELLELIVFRLCLEDIVRLSCVCKEWQHVARSLHVVNQSPWLLFSPFRDGKFKFLDPSQGKLYSDQIPELKNKYILCSKDGWVLLYDLPYSVILFNPFTKSRINIPHCSPLYFDHFALSCGPTSPDSVVFGIRSNDAYRGVTITIFRPGDAKCKIESCQNTDRALFSCGATPVFCNGLFYCLSRLSDYLVGVFDPQKHTWIILPVSPPNLPPLRSDQRRVMHLIECKGKLLLVSVSYPDKPFIFKLDLSQMKWVELESLNGATLFVSAKSSLSATDVPGISRNSVYFSKIHCYGKFSYVYSFDDCRFIRIKEQQFNAVPSAVLDRPYALPGCLLGAYTSVCDIEDLIVLLGAEVVQIAAVTMESIYKFLQHHFANGAQFQEDHSRKKYHRIPNRAVVLTKENEALLSSSSPVFI
ncbi:hypothetical protein NE237_000256 [Protea cynaroides]|uniref:F-box domain-containing protein n=1 Tax=Protea cynaroides TaxID=273540 RepID=A0A9Q0QXB3_9MAGN|nr:hypothetical protein NE237_000256 [Protea cynaroides]